MAALLPLATFNRDPTTVAQGFRWQSQRIHTMSFVITRLVANHV